MPFTAASDSDVWYRCLIKPAEQPDEAGEFKNVENAFEAPRDTRPWLLECSGRLESIDSDHKRYAASISASENARLTERNAAAGKKPVTNRAYRGRWHAIVQSIRSVQGFDVYHEATDGDDAHANLVVTSEARLQAGKLSPEAVVALTAVLSVEVA